MNNTKTIYDLGFGTLTCVLVLADRWTVDERAKALHVGFDCAIELSCTCLDCGGGLVIEYSGEEELLGLETLRAQGWAIIDDGAASLCPACAGKRGRVQFATG